MGGQIRRNMKNNNIRVLIIISILAFAVSGCAEMRDKFIRKPKEEKRPMKRYQPVKEYDVRPNLELYTKRYVFWKNWHRELLSVLRDDNHKKKVVAAEQELSNLMDMQSMLVDEKADQLQKCVDEMTEIEMTLKKEKVTSGNEVRIRRQLESLGREIKKKFSYNKVRGFIRNDFRRE